MTDKIYEVNTGNWVEIEWLECVYENSDLTLTFRTSNWTNTTFDMPSAGMNGIRQLKVGGKITTDYDYDSGTIVIHNMSPGYYAVQILFGMWAYASHQTSGESGPYYLNSTASKVVALDVNTPTYGLPSSIGSLITVEQSSNGDAYIYFSDNLSIGNAIECTTGHVSNDYGTLSIDPNAAILAYSYLIGETSGEEWGVLDNGNTEGVIDLTDGGEMVFPTNGEPIYVSNIVRDQADLKNQQWQFHIILRIVSASDYDMDYVDPVEGYFNIEVPLGPIVWRKLTDGTWQKCSAMYIKDGSAWKQALSVTEV